MSEVVNVAEIFGKNVFNETVMRERLPKSVFKKLKKTIEDGAELDPSIADVVAHAMKDWAIERGATHYTHWFQPLTGITAESMIPLFQHRPPREKSSWSSPEKN